MTNKELNIEEILDNIPDETANLQLPDYHLRNYYRDEQDRVLWIEDNISDDTLVINEKILRYNKEDKDIPVEERKPIKIFINTMGGAVDVMLIIMNTIKMSKTPIWTINWCCAFSAGALILASGHKRFTMPGACVLIHSGSCAYSGTQEQAESAKKHFDKITKQADNLFLDLTKIDSKVFRKRAPFDWYLTDEEALEQGIVDKIVESFDEIY